MTDQIKHWMQEFVKTSTSTVTVREMYYDFECDGCDCDFTEATEIWTGTALGMPSYTICGACHESVSVELLASARCNYGQLIMFKDDPIDACTPFNLREGWYRDVKNDEYLCQYHGQKLMASEDPVQDKWKAKFSRVSIADLVRVDLTSTEPLYYDEGGRGAAFRATPVELRLPACVSDERYLEVAQKWFGIQTEIPLETTCNDETKRDCESVRSNEEKENNDDEKKEASITNKESGNSENNLRTPWAELTSCNGSSLSYMVDSFLVADPKFSNICEWVPFDETDERGHQLVYEGYAIVNCNPESPEFEQVATVIFDSHYRVSVDYADMKISEYIMMQQHYQAALANAELFHPGITCNECKVSPITGQRWTCPNYCNYDMCNSCHQVRQHIKNGELHEMRLEEAPIISFIEEIRTRLGQGFYFG
jgi:hypothetical protein